MVLVLNNHYPSYEFKAIEKASEFEKELFDRIVYAPLKQGYSLEEFKSVITFIGDYLAQKATEIYQPLFDYYKKEARGESFSDISFKFCTSFSNAIIGFDCLVDDGTLCKVKKPIYLTKKSRIEFEEYEYYLTEMV